MGSSGLCFGGGGAADPTRESARRFGIDLASHLTRQLGRAELLATDVLLAMEADHLVGSSGDFSIAPARRIFSAV